MYLYQYGLKAKPFQISTDPTFLWMGEKHREALAVLVYGVHSNRGFLMLSGGVGTGKTTLIRSLLAQLDKKVTVATITDPGLAPMEFFTFIAQAYGMRRRYTNKVDFLFDFEKFLRRTRDAGRTVLLIVDEAQRLNQTLLEEIRLLSNIEDPDQKLLNIFFVGQEEFLEILAAPENRSLKQRITINYHLETLNAEETEQLVRHRLNVAGATREVFTPDAFPEIYAFSGGAPRLINILCDHALLTGFVRDVDTIDANIVAECVEDLMLPGEAGRTPRRSVRSEPPPPIAHQATAAASAGMMLQQRPSPPQRRKWPWAAALLLMLAVGLGVLWEQGVLTGRNGAPDRGQAPENRVAAAPVPSVGDSTAGLASPASALPKEPPPARDSVAKDALPNNADNAGSTPSAAHASATRQVRQTPATEEAPLIGHEIPDPLSPEPAQNAQAAKTASDERVGLARTEPAAAQGDGEDFSSSAKHVAPAADTAAAPVETSAGASTPPAADADADEGSAGPDSTTVVASRGQEEVENPSPIPLAAFGRPTPVEETPPDTPLPAVTQAPSANRRLDSPTALQPISTEDRLRTFIDAYCRAYESRDLARFRLFFTEDAIERGRPIETVLPVYARNFASLAGLTYDIELLDWKRDAIAEIITLDGIFNVRYRLPGSDWQTTRGEITMDLKASAGLLRVKRLDYEKK